MTLPNKKPKLKIIKNVVGVAGYSTKSAYNGKWSPKSEAGKQYEWDRGVIGVSEEGETSRECLDETTTHHASATLKIAQNFNIPISKTIHPFKAGIICANHGILIMQFEGDNAYLYFPLNITKEQLTVLNDILEPRQSFEYSYVHDENIFDGKKSEDVIQYAQTITKEKIINSR